MGWVGVGVVEVVIKGDGGVDRVDRSALMVSIGSSIAVVDSVVGIVIVDIDTVAAYTVNAATTALVNNCIDSIAVRIDFSADRILVDIVIGLAYIVAVDIAHEIIVIIGCIVDNGLNCFDVSDSFGLVNIAVVAHSKVFVAIDKIVVVTINVVHIIVRPVVIIVDNFHTSHHNYNTYSY